MSELGGYEETEETPAYKYFSGSTTLLSGGRFQDDVTQAWTFTEVTLRVTYDLYGKSVLLSIYDKPERRYRLDETVQDYASAKQVIEQVTADYPDKVKAEEFLPIMESFFKVVPSVISIDGRVTETSYRCSQCGDYNTDQFSFFYAPAVPGTALGEASLDLHWDYGCYGGEEVSGEFSEAETAVREMLGRMMEFAAEEYKADIRKALQTVEQGISPAAGQ